jgi:hypothetical protein
MSVPVPSTRQQQIVDTVAGTGSVAAAAAALGISALTVDRALSAYHRRVCSSLVADLEAELDRLRERVAMDRAAHRLEQVVGRIERAVAPVSHRRLADGGAHANDQRRAASRVGSIAPGVSRDVGDALVHKEAKVVDNSSLTSVVFPPARRDAVTD